MVAKDNFEDERVISNNSVNRKRFDNNLTPYMDNEYNHIQVQGGNFNCTRDDQIDRDPQNNQRDQGYQGFDGIM